MRRVMAAVVTGVIVIAVMPVVGARAASMTIYVTSTSDDGSPTVGTATTDCTGPSSTKCTLEDALALANGNPGSTINVEAGDFVVDGELQITEPVTINGQGASPLGTAISQTPGDKDSDLVVSSPGAVSISGSSSRAATPSGPSPASPSSPASAAGS